MTNEEVRLRIQNSFGVYEDFLSVVKKRKLRRNGHISRSSGMAKTIQQETMKGARRTGTLRIWHGEDNSAGDNERSKKERKTEVEMGRWHQGMDRNGVWRFPEGSGRQGKVERHCCNVVCAAPTTAKLRD